MNAIRCQEKTVPDFSRPVVSYFRIINGKKSRYIVGREGPGDFKHIVPDNTESGTLNEEMFTWISILNSYER